MVVLTKKSQGDRFATSKVLLVELRKQIHVVCYEGERLEIFLRPFHVWKQSYIEIQKRGGYRTHEGKDKQRLKTKKRTKEIEVKK